MTRAELMNLILNSKTPAMPADSVQFADPSVPSARPVQKKTFEVELKRESYIVLTVEAADEAEAEALAWREVEGRPDSGDASWGVESVEELK